MTLAVSIAQGGSNNVTMRNRLINGNFSIAQRGTGSSATPSAGVTTYPSLDRWFIAQTGTTASIFFGQTTAQTTGVYTAAYFGRISGQTNVPAAIFMGQQIESFNVYDLRGKSVTLSFNAFRGANAPATLSCEIRFGTGVDQTSSTGLGGTWTGYSSAAIPAYTVGTTVASYTSTVAVPSNASEMMVLFYYTPTGTAGANEWFAFENIQLEAGTTATPFENRLYGTELALCQRYYQKHTGDYYSSYGATYNYVFVPWKVTMRASPTVTGLGGGTQDSATVDLATAYTAGSAYAYFSSPTASAEL